MREEEFAAKHSTPEIHPHQPSEVLQIELIKRTRHRNSRIVDEQVDLTVFSKRAGHQISHLIFAGYIRRVGCDMLIGIGKLYHSLLERTLVEIDQGKMPAAL